MTIWSPARKDSQKNHFAIFDMMDSPFEMSLDLTDIAGTLSDEHDSSLMVRSCGFEPVLNPRTQVMMI
jgi:hypothetical protein